MLIYPVDGEAFVKEMDATLWQILSNRDAVLSRIGESAGKADIGILLLGALRAELEATEIAARWVASTPELEAKIAFAQQAGDEARHYQLISERLRELGNTRAGEDPVTSFSKLFQYLETLTTTGERIAAAQFTREAIGYKSNQLFIALCEEVGDTATARMYTERIQPDEKRHHEWGKRLLPQYTAQASEQELARKAILRTLELAEELRSLAAGRLLVETLPGC
ncbi:MAG: ferritin-like domain-containing protein [Vicinamibacteria bacterium]